jgi:hypothetical protein
LSIGLWSLIFITPIPPTKREIAATAPSRTVRVEVVDLAVLSSVAWLITLNGRSATVVLLFAARMLSTSLSARSRVDDDLPWTISSLNDCEYPVSCPYIVSYIFACLRVRFQEQVHRYLCPAVGAVEVAIVSVVVAVEVNQTV